MSECKFRLNVGHSEYMLHLRKGELTALWTHDDIERIEDLGSIGDTEWERRVRAAYIEKIGNDPDEDDVDVTWQALYEVNTTEAGLERALADLLKDLEEDPGGDDGTFDYWPSGLRMAMDVAEHLGTARSQEVAGAVRVLILTMRPEFKEELLISVGLEE